MRPEDATGSVFGLTRRTTEAGAKRLRADYGAPASFGWQMLRRTCGTYLTNAPGIFGAASAYRSAKQLGHSVAVAERHYVGLVRGISAEARTLEAAMQIAETVSRGADVCAKGPRDLHPEERVKVTSSVVEAEPDRGSDLTSRQVKGMVAT